MTKKKTKNQTTKHNQIPNEQQSSRDVPTTLLDHVIELKNRLFWVAMFFVVSAATVYPFFTQIVEVLTAPLAGEELHYFSPAGGLGFIIKICMYLGIVGALPAFVYHLYKFIQPAMTEQHARSLIGYTLASGVLAVCGILFTYNIILPAAVTFLTSFEIAGVDPMLSADSYMAFVIAYIVAGAFLFQLPLVMLIINSITPLTPSGLLSYERHIIIGAFVIAAVLSPTPDVVNQALLALPLVVMYQVGFVLVVVKNRMRHNASKVSAIDKLRRTDGPVVDDTVPIPDLAPQPTAHVAAVTKSPHSGVTMDVRQQRSAITKPHALAPPAQPKPTQQVTAPLQAASRRVSIDGTLRSRRHYSAAMLRRPQTATVHRVVNAERAMPSLQSSQRLGAIDGMVRSQQF